MTWSYRPPWFRAGFALSLGAAAFILLLLAGGPVLVRSGRTREFTRIPARPAGLPSRWSGRADRLSSQSSGLLPTVEREDRSGAGQDSRTTRPGRTLRAGEAGTVRDSGTIWYRGAGYQLGRGTADGYAIWAAGGPPAQPLEQWPETPAGWSAAWSRFNAVEAPGTIVHLGPPADPVPAPPAGPVPPPRLLARSPPPPRLLARSPPRLLARSPPRLLARSPPRLLARSPPRLLARSPPRLPARSPGPSGVPGLRGARLLPAPWRPWPVPSRPGPAPPPPGRALPARPGPGARSAGPARRGPRPGGRRCAWAGRALPRLPTCRGPASPSSRPSWCRT